MTLVEIPLNPIPNQELTVSLKGQQVTINVYLQDNGLLYAHVWLGTEKIVSGAQASDVAYVNQYPTALVGNLFWFTEDGQNPKYTTLGGTAHLLYADYDALAFDYDWWVRNNT